MTAWLGLAFMSIFAIFFHPKPEKNSKLRKPTSLSVTSVQQFQGLLREQRSVEAAIQGNGNVQRRQSAGWDLQADDPP